MTSSLVQEIKDAIATESSKRHVPRYIFETPEIPVRGPRPSFQLPTLSYFPQSSPISLANSFPHYV